MFFLGGESLDLSDMSLYLLRKAEARMCEYADHRLASFV